MDGFFIAKKSQRTCTHHSCKYENVHTQNLHTKKHGPPRVVERPVKKGKFRAQRGWGDFATQRGWRNFANCQVANSRRLTGSFS